MLDGILADVGAADPASLPAWQAPLSLQDDAPGAFTAGVSRILEYLVAGDVFQVNISRAWRGNESPPCVGISSRPEHPRRL